MSSEGGDNEPPTATPPGDEIPEPFPRARQIAQELHQALAADLGDEAIIKRHLERRTRSEVAAICTLPVDDKTVFQSIVEKDRGAVLEYLLMCAIDAAKLDEYALHVAVAKKATRCFKLLITSGAPVGIQGPDGKTPLHVAAEIGDPMVVRAILTSTTFKRSMVHQLEMSGCTPLSLACMNGHELIVKMLVDAGAEVNDLNCVYPPLHSAAFAGEVTVMKMLVLTGADINMTDRAGETPLHYAAFQGFTEIVQLLLSRQARIDIADRQGRRPMDLAKTEELKQMLHCDIEAVEVEDTMQDGQIEYIDPEGGDTSSLNDSPLQFKTFDTTSTTF